MYGSEKNEIIFNNYNSWKKDTEDFQKASKYREKCRYYCDCGHSVIMPYNVDKAICSWCKHYVYKKEKDDKRYFKDKLRQLLNEK